MSSSNIKLVYQVAAFIGAISTALIVCAFFGISHLSDECTSNPNLHKYDFVLIGFSLFNYLLAFAFVGKFYRRTPFRLFSGRLNWLVISVIGAVITFPVFEILDSFQCSRSLITNIGGFFLSWIIFSVVFSPIMFGTFLTALLIEIFAKAFLRENKLQAIFND